MPVPLGPLTAEEFFFYQPNAQFNVTEYTERDYDSDTQPDVLAPVVGIGIDAPATGRVTVYSGWFGTTLFEVTGIEPDDFFAYSTAGVDDITGDGLPDLLVGAPASDMGENDAGRAYLYSGADGSLLTTFTGAVADAAFGFVVASAGDLDGDGLGDLMVSAPFDTAGKVFVFFSTSIVQPDGSLLANLTTADANIVLSGENANDDFGFSISSAGDVNADGVPDIIVGAPWNDADAANPDDNRGRVYTYSGSAGALLGTVTGDIPLQYLGFSVSTAGDLNNDGKDDIFMGAPAAPNMTGGGRAFLFYSVAPGAGPTSRSCASADVILTPNITGGNANDSLFGLFVTLGNDVDRDGHGDLIVHAGAHDSMGDIADTRAYVFSGAPDANAALLYTFVASDPIDPPPPPPTGGALDQLKLVIDNFGQQNATAATGDLNGDGVVDALDLAIAVQNLNNQSNSGSSADGCYVPDCLGTLSVDPETGECLCNGQPTGVHQTGDGGPNFPNPNAAQVWCDQCNQYVPLPQPPFTEEDCEIIAYCQMLTALCAQAQSIQSQLDAKENALRTQEDLATTARNAGLAGDNQQRFSDAVAQAKTKLSRAKKSGIGLSGGVGLAAGAIAGGLLALSGPIGWGLFAITIIATGTAAGGGTAAATIASAQATYNEEIAQATANFPTGAEGLQSQYEQAMADAAAQHAAACATINDQIMQLQNSIIDRYITLFNQCVGLP